MKAKKILEKFVEDSDPISDMGIGEFRNPEKQLFIPLKRELKLCGIDIKWGRPFDKRYGNWDFEVNFPFYEEENEIDIIMQYTSKEAAKEYDDDWKGGFEILNEEGNTISPFECHDYMKILKILVKIQYGKKQDIKNKISKLQKDLSYWQHALNI